MATRSMSRARAVRSLWPKRGPAPSPGARSSSCRRRPLPGPAPSSASTRPRDQRRYFVPCPHCEHRQWLRFEQLRWEKGQPDTAAYVCESCEAPIAEHHKTGMLEHGEWRALAPENGSRTAGFHLSSLYSPVGWRSWRDIAAAWESAVNQQSGSSAAIKTFKNTELGETWVEEGEAPDWQRLLERREDYPDRQRARRRPAAGRRGRRAEGSHRGLGLGLRPRQGVVADRASGADGRHRARCGVETPGRDDCGNLDPRVRRPVAAGTVRPGHRLRDPGGVCLRPRQPRSPGHGGQGRGPRCGAHRHADGGRCLRRRQAVTAGDQGVRGGGRHRQAGVLQQPAQGARKSPPMG